MQPVRVMTFNIRGFRPYDGVNFWPERASLNVETIKRSVPDVIGLQECQRGNLLTYLAELGDYQWVLGQPGGVSTETDHTMLYNPMFWRAKRFDLLASGGIWLSETPEVWSKAWGSREVRTATWVKLIEKQTRAPWLFFNTHYDHVSFPAHIGSTRLILCMADELGEEGGLPTIVLGDFNSNDPFPSPTNHHPDLSYQLFLEQSFQDTFLEAGNTDNKHTSTYHGFRGDEYIPAGDHMDRRIDWILMRGGRTPLRCTSTTILRDAEPPRYPSDHYPVLADVVIESAG